MIKLEPGEMVCYRGRSYQIKKAKNLDFVYVIDCETKVLQVARISELEERQPDSTAQDDPLERPFESYSQKQQEKANWRLNMIKPFLDKFRGDKAELKKTAEANGVAISTLYKWRAKFDQYGHVGCLVDSEFKGGKGNTRLDQNIEKQISEVIENEYLELKTINETYDVLRERLAELGLKVPHKNTLRRRIQQTPLYQRVSKRLGPRTAAQIFDARAGKTPYGSVPLALVQIDHTQLDIMLVDGDDRKHFTRPWITVVIDTFSRMVLGFYISFDKPGAYATGRAIAQAILRKEKYLNSVGLNDVKWQCWGKMTTIYCDNAKEFHGAMLKETCSNYGITLKWRPKGKPQYGGIIERYMGTIATELSDLPGCTKRSKEMRARFMPENTASFTLAEFEKWFALWLTEVYHKREHRGIDSISPEVKWKQGIEGYGKQKGIGVPPVFPDENRIRLDFLPQYKRTIQRTGVHLFTMRYYQGLPGKWINAKDENVRGKEKPKRLFTFKVDPMDLSSIMFLNPDDNQYQSIQATINIKPDRMSLWDHRRAVEEAKRNKKKVDQNSILVAHRRLRELEKNAEQKTKEAKKRAERDARAEKDKPIVAIVPPKGQVVSSSFKSSAKELKPYEETEFARRSFK